MAHPRPSAWALICVLVGGLLGPAGTAVTIAAESKQCTGWTDEYHPPTEIRVLRRSGPNAGRVEVVPFWNYVGTVLAAEYSTSGPRGPIWFRMGALSVKQYAWYYTMHYRGGKVTNYNEDGSVASVDCWDVRDTTRDQIYKPERLINGQWVPANVPSAWNLAAMADTWHMSLRKWVTKKKKKNTSRFFLTGYRSGKKNPCGADAKGFRIMQKSLADCIVKGLVYEETTRVYYEPNVLIVDPRERDILDDNSTYWGDQGVLSLNGSTNWHIFAGADGGFGARISGSFPIDPNNVAGQGMGDVTGDGRNDLVMLVGNTLRLARATGTGYDAPLSQDLPGGAPTTRMVVADFDGDLLADVGLLRSTPVQPLPGEPATMVVMRGVSNGTFSSPVDWWRGALDLASQQVAAGDVNGDGKADLVMSGGAAGVTFSVAPSFASCADLSARGPCTSVPGTGLDVAAAWLNKANWEASQVKWTLTDFNRDGRSDLVAVVRDGGGVAVVGGQALRGGGFSDTSMMLGINDLALEDVNVIGSEIDPDGLGDLVLLRKNGGNTAVQWLRASQAAGSAAITYVPTTPFNDGALGWAPATTKAY